MNFTAVLERESDGGYVVSVPVLPGCVSQGDTRDAAMANIHEAIEIYLQDCLASGDAIPEQESVEYVEMTMTKP